MKSAEARRDFARFVAHGRVPDYGRRLLLNLHTAAPAVAGQHLAAWSRYEPVATQRSPADWVLCDAEPPYAANEQGTAIKNKVDLQFAENTDADVQVRNLSLQSEFGQLIYIGEPIGGPRTVRRFDAPIFYAGTLVLRER